LNGGVLYSRNFPLQIVKRCREPFDGDEWLFEIKHDGFRVLAIRDGGSPRLFTRNGYDISRRHRQITERLNELFPERFVLDGEMVVLDDDGRSNFAKLAHGRTGSHYYAFDILMLGKDDLRGLPISERKAILKALVSEGDAVRYTDHVVGIGREFFDAVKRAGLEGMVAKRWTSKYAGMLTDDWLKVKCLRTHDFIVGGWIPGGGCQFGALLLGELIDGHLRYVGQVGSSSNVRVMRAIMRMLTPRLKSPFSDKISHPGAKFYEPAIRVGVEFQDMTDDGYLRHAAFRRFADELTSPL
jgi:bifunctional non-homologous end joining protein LigD